MFQNRHKFFSKNVSFFIASMGTAFGLGNLWRFPYVVSEYGGGAFVFLYVLLAIFIGTPLVISEVILGKYLLKEDTSILRLIEKMSVPKIIKSLFKTMSWVPLVVAFGVLTYCSILSGWALYLFYKYLISFVFQNYSENQIIFINLKYNSMLQVSFLGLHLLFLYYIYSRGVQFIVSKWLSVVFPLFLIFLFYISYQIVSAEDLLIAAKYMIYPNFHLLTFKSLSYILGHVLFTMSLGFSIYVSFSSFLSQEKPSTLLSSKVPFIDTLTSLAVGFVIFPMIIISGYTGRMSEALFRAFPAFLGEKNYSPLIAAVFYFCVFIVSVNASLGLIEGIVYRARKHRDFSRFRVLTLTIFFAFICASFVIFLENFFIGINLIEILDDILINFFLPFSALFFSLLTLICVDKKFIEAEFDIESSHENKTIYKIWKIFGAIVLPAFLIVSIALRLFG